MNKIIKKGIVGLAGLIGLSLLGLTSITAVNAYYYNKSMGAKWAENSAKMYEKGNQYRHPSKADVVISRKWRDNNQDIYLWKNSYWSSFLRCLSQNLNTVLGTKFKWDAGYYRLTKDESIDKDPAFSPDGNYIAFSSDRHGTFDIFIMPTNPRVTVKDWVIPYVGDETKPQWLSNDKLRFHRVEGGKSFYETIKLEGNHPIRRYEVLERKIIE